MVRFSVDFEKKDLRWLAVALVLVLGVGLVIGFNSGNPSVHGHDANEIQNNVIVCDKTFTCDGLGGLHSREFTSQECGGTLPTESYAGTASIISPCGGMITFRVLDKSSQQTPGVSWTPLNTCCSTASNSRLKVVYNKR